MVNQARQIVEPLQELPLDFDAEALQTVLDEAYGACAQATKGTDGNATHWSIVIDTSCEAPTPHCVGSFRIAPHHIIEDEVTTHWIAVDRLDVVCGDTIIDQGHVAFRSTRVTETNPYPLELKTRGFAYTASRIKDEAEDLYLAAEAFQGHIFLREATVRTEDDHILEDTVMISGNASFTDVQIEPVWEWGVEFIDVALHEWNATPRGGTLTLRTLRDTSYNFTTEWRPLTLLSTQPTIKSGKEKWVGCIAHDNSDACNRSAP